MKLALLEVSHWHFPLYIEALLEGGVEISAVSERDPGVRAKYAEQFGCPGFESWRDALDTARPDAAIAFGRHAEMPEIGRALVDMKVPFAIEKPAGLNAEDVKDLRLRADGAGVPVGVPLVQRVGPVQALLDRLITTEGARFTMTAWRFNAGPPSRYPAMKCGWMLAPEVSGGGCMMNLGAHFIDLALGLMVSPPDTVFAHLDSSLHGEAVEDTALLTMTSKDGGRALIETGYNFPDAPAKREYAFSLSSERHYVHTCPGGVMVTRPGQEAERVEMDLDSDPLYARFARDWLAGLRSGTQTVPGLADLEPAMRIMDAAYTSARTGQAVTLK